MNPLMILGGLGILGVVLMGFKKKPSPTWDYPGFDPYEDQPYQGSRLPPGFGTPDWIQEQEEADSGMFRYAIPGRLA